MNKVIKPSKLYSLEDAVSHIAELKSKGQKVVLTNGCFDLLHVGHIYFLENAAKQGDALWIALNGADSIKELKGDSRPIQGDWERTYALSALECIRGVTLFNTKRLTQEILALKPDVYVKAGDYTVETLDPDERAALDEVRADIRFLPFLEGYSTTSLIDKISKAGSTV